MTLITLQQIRDHRPCKEGWTKLLKTLGNPSDLSMQVSFGDIAKSNDAVDALWCLRALDMSDVANRRFAVSLIMPAVRRASIHTDDKRVHDCIVVLDKWLEGDDTVDLKAADATATARAAAIARAARADAAYAAAYAARAAADATATARAAAYAAYAARADAAYAAAYAARAAADAAYADDANDAADAAERQQQVADIIELSPLHVLKESAQ